MSDDFTTEDLLQHVNAIFKRASDEGLYVGLGYASNLPLSQQEGPMVKKLRQIVESLNKKGKDHV